MPKITIDTDDLPAGFRTADDLRPRSTAAMREGAPWLAGLYSVLANAMPVPLPTTPGSQVRCDGDGWILFADGLWRCYTSDRVNRHPRDFGTLGPVEVIRDAGEA